MPLKIDINCDLGEGYGIEEQIAPYISSANIACGGHAGDDETIKQTVKIASRYCVKVGAHPSYPDRENFGRTALPIAEDELHNSILAQLLRIRDIAFNEGVVLHHVKLHGALYNNAAVEPGLAARIIKLIWHFDSTILFYGPPNSELERQAALHGLTFIREGFADRTYQDDGQLTSRSLEGALIENESKSIHQALSMVCEKSVTSLSGNIISMPVQTICLHGDGKYAVDFAKSLREALSFHKIKVAAPYD